MYEYLDKRFLPNLKFYKYSVRDISPVSIYLLQPYWNYCIRFVPGWIAPNMVTLVGFAALVINYFICFYYMPDFKVETAPPALLIFLMGLGVEWYSLLDNLDGRQARRTQTSSPLGELFDHGCDCLAVAFGSVAASCILNFGPGWMSLLTMITMAAAFWMATWEEYHTGTLFLGYINGPTEGLKIIIFSYWASAYFTPQAWALTVEDFWTVNVSSLLGAFPSFLSFASEWELRQIAVVFSTVPMVLTVFYNIYTVFCTLTARKEPLKDASNHMWTFFIYWGLVIGWFCCSKSDWEQYPHYYQMAAGIGFGEITSRLILAHLCKMKFSVVQRPMAIVLVGMANAYIRYVYGDDVIPEICMMWIFLICSVVGFFHYAVCVIDQLTTFLGIRCLVIPEGKYYKS